MKKIYVLIVEERPMICFEWFEQCVPIIEKYKKVEQKSFSYKKDSEKSLIQALQEALAYCKNSEIDEEEIPTLTALVEDYIIYYNLERKNKESEKKQSHVDDVEFNEEEDENHYADLQINFNSPLVTMVMNIIVDSASFANAGIYTGIDPVLFYYMLVEMCYKPQRTILSKMAYEKGESLVNLLKKQSELNISDDINNLQRDGEYIKLRDRLYHGYLINDFDFKELEARTVHYVTEHYLSLIHI